MNLISIDLEMNKPSNKIIQLGYVIFNIKTQKVMCKTNLYINPQEPIKSEIITLTGITDKIVQEYGLSLLEAYEFMIKEIKKYETNKHPVQWGLDHYELRNQLGFTWDNYIFRTRSHDIKSLYQIWAMTNNNLPTVAGLGRAMSQLGLNFEGQQHNAMDDAYNTMLVMFEIQNKMSSFEKIKKVILK